MLKRLRYLAIFFLMSTEIDGALAGGRLNAFSEGQNAFAGVVNPANAVWIADRFDVGGYLTRQKSSLDNKDGNPLFPKGTTNMAYKAKYLGNADAAIHKQFHLKQNGTCYLASISLASYTLPSHVKVRTKMPFKASGTTPIYVFNKTEALSLVFSAKITSSQSLGVSIDYLSFSHLRNGFQNSDNSLRSVSPGHVTNNGFDHSHGVGITFGWRWNISEKLQFGAAWARKCYCGSYRKYRGFEPWHAKNYQPQTVGGGFTYRFNTKVAGRIEVIWSNFGNLPGANNSVLSNGEINRHKRGSNKSPGPGLNDATFINLGLGYRITEELSIGSGLSHRFKIRNKTGNFISHGYMRQVIYDILSLGLNYNHQKHNLFIGAAWGFENKISGWLPESALRGKLVSKKQTASLSVSWGYLY